MLKLIFGTKPKAKKVTKPAKRNVYAANYGSVQRVNVYNANYGMTPFPNAYSHL